MATKKSNKSNQTRKSNSGRGRTRTARVVEAQKDINQDFIALTEDYGVLAARLWRVPATRYVLGGIALVAIVPAAIKALRKIPKVDHFLDENMNAMSEKIEELENMFMEKFSDYTEGKEDSSKDSHAH